MKAVEKRAAIPGPPPPKEREAKTGESGKGRKVTVRPVQVTGESGMTFYVYLPASWFHRNNVRKGEYVRMTDEGKRLVIEPMAGGS
jgi:hypothetical protein